MRAFCASTLDTGCVSCGARPRRLDVVDIGRSDMRIDEESVAALVRPDDKLRHHRCLALAGLLGIVVGCGPGGPKTYPVKGKVVTAKAEDLKRLVGQAVELQSTVEPNTRGFGQIQA